MGTALAGPGPVRLLEVESLPRRMPFCSSEVLLIDDTSSVRAGRALRTLDIKISRRRREAEHFIVRANK